MIIKGDSVKLKKLVLDFSECVKKYNELVDSFYKEMNKVSDSWVSDASVIYMEKVNNTKVKYTDFGETLSKFSRVLASVADSFETSIDSSTK